MLMSVRRDTAGEHLRLMVCGVVLLAIVSGLIGLSIARYLKVFEPGVMVTLRADEAGLMLPRYGDVRLHGVLVGQIREISHTGKQALIEIAIQPEQADAIPANVAVEILPTTLFGQKYVSFVDPRNPSSETIAEGDVIPPSRVQTSTELNRVLANLFDLLRSVKPADLSYTLNALATALEGRGDQIGRSLEQLGSYVTEINEHMPAIRRDIRLFADVAENYSEVMPDFMRLLRNATVTGRTIIDQRGQLNAFFRDVAGMSATTSDFLRANEHRLIRLGEVARPTLALLDTYSPQYPCLLKGMRKYDKLLSGTFSNGRIHQYFEIGTDQDRGYEPRDKPVYGETGHGPWCAGLPNPEIPAPPISFKDGTNIDNEPDSRLPADLQPFFGPSSFDPTSGFAGTEAEQTVVNALLTDEAGVPVDEIGDVTTLLYGPLVRGEVVGG
ncbi:MAG TPA: MCE family protein [Nocardioidaceae bacterium]|nr:MCE family protein [Nocardioidaceae bacterium]